MIFILISKINNKYIRIALILISFIVPYLISLRNYNFLMLVISRGLVSCGFLAIGYYSKKLLDRIGTIQGIIILAITFITAQLNVNIDLYSLKIGNLALYIFNGTIASIGVIAIAKTLDRNKYLEFCGINTIIIMGTHQWMTRIFTVNIKESSVLLVLLAFVVVMLIEYPLIKVINNKLPFMLGKFRTKDKLKLEIL